MSRPIRLRLSDKPIPPPGLFRLGRGFVRMLALPVVMVREFLRIDPDRE